MRLDIRFTDRVGIASEILAVLARRRINVVAVEVEPPHVYVDVPGFAGEALGDLRASLLRVAGVRAVRMVDMLPGARRRLHLDALLDAMADPVLAVDGTGAIVVANAAAGAAAGVDEAALAGATLDALFDDPALRRDLVAHGFHVPAQEATLRGVPFMLEARPIAEDAPGAASPRPPAARCPPGTPAG